MMPCHSYHKKYYSMLGLKIDTPVNLGELKTIYKKLALQYHPDKGGDPAKFNDLTIAYNYILNCKNAAYKTVNKRIPLVYLYFQREYTFTIDCEKIVIKITSDKIFIPEKNILLIIDFIKPSKYEKINDNLIIKLDISLLTYLSGFNNYKLMLFNEKETVLNSTSLINKNHYIISGGGFSRTLRGVAPEGLRDSAPASPCPKGATLPMSIDYTNGLGRGDILLIFNVVIPDNFVNHIEKLKKILE